MSAALSSWWRTWSRRCVAPDSPHSELVLCWRSGRPLEPTGELRLWLLGLGWDGVMLERGDAGRWLAVWQRERLLQRRRVLPRAAAGPGVWRPPLATPFAIGRTLFNRQGARPARLRGADGLWHEGPEAMDLVLWRSREAIWVSCPAAPAHAGPALDAYFEGRRAPFPQGPAPTVEGMLRVVLAPAGSAPGADNEPYELYHVGAPFCGAVIGARPPGHGH